MDVRLCKKHNSASQCSDISLKRKRLDRLSQTEEPTLANCKCLKTDTIKLKHQGLVPCEWFLTEPHDGGLSKVFSRDASNFQRSAVPVRVLYHDKAEWKDYSKSLTAIICESFKLRRSLSEFCIDEKKYVVSFSGMLQLNVLTGFVRSIAWIDEHNKCYFPSKVVECHCYNLLNESKLGFADEDHKFNIEPCSISDHDISVSSSEQSEVTSVSRECTQTPHSQASCDFSLLGERLQKLVEGDGEFSCIKNKFLMGLGALAQHTVITGIHRNSHTTTSFGQARLEAFRKQEEYTRAARGDANVKYAWHGSSRQGVSGIVLHGFGQPRVPKNGAVYGIGVYLTPEEYAHVSAVYSDIDENGEQHILLCQAILGSMEQVCSGSEQFHPSTEDYDTGVDNMCNPKRYIIWSTHMNTHILPQYIISFKLAPSMHAAIMVALRGKRSNGPCSAGSDVKGCVETEQCPSLQARATMHAPACYLQSSNLCRHKLRRKYYRAIPRSPWISFGKLLTLMETRLSPADMDDLRQWYVEFQAGIMPREKLVENVRSKVSSEFLRNCIENKEIQLKVAAANCSI